VFCEEVNNREHRETRRRPVHALAEERTRLHLLPTQPFTMAFGTTRRVYWDSTVSVESVTYSVPDTPVDTRVWVRLVGDEAERHGGGRGRSGRGRPPRPLHPRATRRSNQRTTRRGPITTVNADHGPPTPRRPRSWLSDPARRRG
jgi:hypothetical protein